MLTRWTAGGMLLCGLILLGLGVNEQFFGECSKRNGGCIPAEASGGELQPTPVVDNGPAAVYFALGGVMVVIGTIWLLINGAGSVKGSAQPSIPTGPSDHQIRAMAIHRQAQQEAARRQQPGPPPPGTA